MGRTKPPYPAAFRQQVVELFHAERSQSELSREFDVSAATIAGWIARAAADAGQPLPGKDVLTTAEREELLRLRRENRRLQTANAELLQRIETTSIRCPRKRTPLRP